MTLATSAKTFLYERYVPVIPDEFKIYDSYAVDPQWQIKFTIIWTSVLALSTMLSAPYIYRSLRRGAYFKTLAVNEAPAKTLSGTLSKSSPSAQHKTRGGPLARTGLLASALYQSIALRSVATPRAGKGPRRYFNLGTGQCAIIAVYLAVSIVCFTVGAELLQNSNRPGFVALSQLPLIVLLSLKSPLPLPIFLPTLSYEHYNFLHRYAGRTLFLLVTVHGAMWINQFRTTNQMDQVWSEKSKRGMIAYGLMCGVVLTSLKPVRRMCYQVFWLSHLVLFTGFFAAISYHTPYAAKWVYPCVAIYGYDFTVRMLRYRVKDAIIVPVDGTTTLIHIPDCGSGWKPTQHIFLRVLRGPGIFESHPFTITNAPALPGASASPRGITLYAKAAGDWTKRLHALANDVAALEIGEDVYEREAFLKLEKDGQVNGADHPGKRVTVILDGPYGALKIDVGDYGRVLCLAGGSGITFALGVIEASICARVGGVIRNVEVVWAVREASLVQALGPTLVYLHRTARAAGLVLNILIHMSGESDTFASDFTALLGQLPQAATIHFGRPDVSAIVKTAAGDAKSPRGDEQNASIASGAGFAVVSCGPGNLVAETREAVGALSIREKMAAGGVAFHGETYSL